MMPTKRHMILLTVERSKHGEGWAFGPGLNLSGVTPGERVGLAFHRSTLSARLRTAYRARQASLEHSTVLRAFQFGAVVVAGPVDSYRKCGRRCDRCAAKLDAWATMAMVATAGAIFSCAFSKQEAGKARCC